MRELIRKRESVRFPGLFVEKYVKKVFYKQLWDEDPAIIESRGLVRAASGKVVARPFTKIFNRCENNTDIDRDEKVLWVRKVNGFMGACTFVDCVGGHGQFVVSTTGSLDSDFVKLAEKYLLQKHLTEVMWHGMTYLFEIVDPSDRHIIPEVVGAHLIGVRDVYSDAPYFSTPSHEEWLDEIALHMGVHRPEWGVCRFSDVVQETKTCKHEGFVVYGQTSKTVLKIKSPYYLALKAAARCKDIASLKRERVDEEFYPLLDKLIEMGVDFNNLSEQDRLELIKEIYDTPS